MDNRKYPDIVFIKDMLSGSPTINRRRLSVGDVVSLLKYSDTVEELEQDYQISKKQIKQALVYCANQQCLEDKPLKYCHNCTLRTKQDPPLDLSLYEEVIIEEEVYTQGEGSTFFGTLAEFIREWNGTEWWKESLNLLAEHDLKLANE